MTSDKKVHFEEETGEAESEQELDDDVNRQFNKFQLLDLPEDDEIEEPDSTDLHESNQELSSDNSGSNKNSKPPTSTSTSSKRKRKRNRNRSKQKSSASKDFDLDELLAEQSTGTIGTCLTARCESEARTKLLKLDMRNLIPETELKRIFGKGVLKEEKSKEQKQHRLYTLTTSNYRSKFVSMNQDLRALAALPNMGPRMELDEMFNDGRKTGTAGDKPEMKVNQSKGKKQAPSELVQPDTNQPIYFRFIHDRTYQAAQQLFLEAAHQGNSDAIINNLSAHPTHVESLVQLSDMIRITEDYKSASEFIERALLIFEKGFHPRFNFISGNCRLSYRRPENRTFFITIFKHILYCNRRGLRRTPLEYAKFLLALDPENDPLFASFLLDFFALRSEDYDYLIEFVSKFQYLSSLPNMSFSLALAHFMKSKNAKYGKETCETSLKLADEKLQEALLRYPNFVVILLDACQGDPSAELKKCDYFDYSAYGQRYNSAPEPVDLMVRIYVERTSMLWKQKSVLTWLEANIAIMVQKFANNELVDEGQNKKHWACFQCPSPRNLLRHIVLADMKLKVPSSSAQASSLDIDPYPPESITSYSIRANDNNPSAFNLTNFGLPSLFLRSIWPSFNIGEGDQPQ